MPELGLGCGGLGSLGRHGIRLVHQAVDSGVTVFDTADAYGAGSSERLLGAALRGHRDRVSIATKVGYLFEERSRASIAARRVAQPAIRALRSRAPGAAAAVAARGYRNQDFSPSYLRGAVEASLRRLRTDYLDLVQLHGPPTLLDGMADLASRLRDEGKIRHFGVELEALEGASEWVESGLIDRIQVPFGILNPQAGAEVIPAASRAGVGVWAAGIFPSELLAPAPGTARTGPRREAGRVDQLRRLGESEGVSCLQLAAWFVARDGVSTALIGTTSLSELQAAVDSFRLKPAPGIVAKLEDLASSWVEAA